MAALETKHKMFLQGMMSRKILSGVEVKQLFNSCCETSGETASQDPGDLAGVVNTVNIAIKPFNMKVTKGIGEEDGKNYYALLNLQESAITRLSTNYSKSEMEFFLKLVDLIIESEIGEVTSLSALNLTDKLTTKSMSKMDAQELLERLQIEHWLKQYNKGKLSLGTLAILELDQYMREEFEGVPICKMCRQVVLRGPSCESCDMKLHSHCANRVFQDIRHRICPGCNADWSSGQGSDDTMAESGSTNLTNGSSQKRHRSK